MNAHTHGTAGALPSSALPAGTAEHDVPMATRTVGDVSPTSPSPDGVAKTARYSVSTDGEWLAT
jgi:hypothetical protein